MFLHALMICGVRALTHICWPNSCNNLGDDCCPLLISAAEGNVSLYLSFSSSEPSSFAQLLSPTLRINMTKLRAEASGMQTSSQLCCPGSISWQSKVGQTAGKSSVFSCPEKPFRSVRLWRMVNAFKKRKMNRFMQDDKVSLAIQEKTFKCSLSQSTGQMLIMLGSLLNTGA